MKVDLGCAFLKTPGWIGVDIVDYGQEIVADVRNGIPLGDGSVEEVVANHSLNSFTWHELPPLFAEVHRVLTPGGTFHVLVPALSKAYEWLMDNRGLAHGVGWLRDVIDVEAAPSPDDAFCAYVTWWSHSRSVFTGPYLDQLAATAGFSLRDAAPPPHQLDSRLDESLRRSFRK